MTDRSPRAQDLADERRDSMRSAWLKISLGCFGAWLLVVLALAVAAAAVRWAAP